MSEILDSRFEHEWHEALSHGELRVQRCAECDTFIMYPKYRCPECGSSSLLLVRASGRGVLTSFAVIRSGSPSDFVLEIPYAVGVVRLSEGVQVLARLTPDDDGEWNSFACDIPVHFVAPAPSARGSAPWFVAYSNDAGA